MPITSRVGRRSTRQQSGGPFWARVGDERLLDLRLGDLDLDLESSPLMALIDKVRAELAATELRVRPHFWLSDEWFSPANVPGVAVPFYLAHPRLARLEQRMHGRVEGGSRGECLRILRHELGHVVQEAYGLHRRRRWQQLFGSPALPYPEEYRPTPLDRRFVQHLNYWYAQSHPVEDFAETFAVWLTPRSGWRRRYAGWAALEKLQYVSELMEELAGQAPTVRSRRRVDALHTLKKTLRQHYRGQEEQHGAPLLHAGDNDLLQLFSSEARHRSNESAATFLRRNRRQWQRQLGEWIDDHSYTVDHVLEEFIGRCSQLDLRVREDECVPENESTLKQRCLKPRCLKQRCFDFLALQSLRRLYRGEAWRTL